MSLVLPRSRATFMPGWVRNDLWRRARAVPSLDLQFADRKSLVDAISGQNLVTFTRASGGTYVDSAGVLRTAANDEPRFDHNPTTGESLGLLVEEQRTNLLVRSEEFSNTAWTTSSSVNIIVTADQAISPGGTTTADRVQGPSGTTGTTYFQQTYATTAGANASYTFSIYLRSNTGVNQTLRLKNTHGGVLDNFSSNITITTSWQRFSFTVTNGASAGTSQICGLVCDTSNNAFDVLAWGAQLEAGAFPTSYIPTTGSAATRNADVASITGTNFSSWYRQDEGTFYGDTFRPFAVPPSDFPLIADSRVATDRVQIGYLTEGLASAIVRVGGTMQAEMYPGSGNTRNRKVAFGAAANNFGVTCNGGSESTDTSGSMPTAMISLGIGSHTQNDQYLNGTIRRLTYWNQRLPNAALRTITQ